MSNELIRNCKFRYKCSESWNSMANTDDPDVRHCSTCNENVHLCIDADDVLEALQNNWCVAIYNTSQEEVAFLGDVDPGYFVNKYRDLDW